MAQTPAVDLTPRGLPRASRSRGCGRPRKISRSWPRKCAQGLEPPLPTLPSKYFYDARGSALFERITTLPEYYLDPRGGGDPRARGRRHRRARASRASWSSSGPGWAPRPAGCSIASPRGTRALRVLHPARRGRGGAADVARRPRRRLSGPARARHRRRLPARHPRRSGRSGGRRMIGFLGGTIGNLDPDRVPAFFRAAASVLDPGDTFLLGADLVKDVARLEAAYNDSAGVTAEFNRNLLARRQRAAGRRLRRRGASSTSPSTTPPGSGSRCACGPPGPPPSTSRKRAWSGPLPRETRSAPRSAASTRASAWRACSQGTGLAIEAWYTDAAAAIRRNSAPARQLGRLSVRLS